MPHLIILTWDVHLMDYLAPVSVAHDGLGLGDDCWCQMFSPEPVQDSDPDWTPPTLLLLPPSLCTPVAVTASPQITIIHFRQLNILLCLHCVSR